MGYDHIIIGAGSAGCVLAHRLVRGGRRVLLLEAGPSHEHPFVRMPAAFVRVIGTERSWDYVSEAQPDAGGRRMHVPQGRMLGGSSSLNAMVYIRGTASDYDGWRDGGCAGWGWNDVLPAFKRAEANELYAEPLHGTGGPLRVSEPRFRHPLSQAFVKAAQQAGLPVNYDFNGATQTGVGFYQSTTFNGERGSTAATYLAAVRSDSRLAVRTGVHVTRLLIEAGRAVGVEFVEAGQARQARCTRDVLVCAGALASPKLLMLSGIGPGAQLQSLGIPLLQDSPGVGQNYQDHLEVSVYARTRAAISLLGQDRGLRALRHGMQWQFFRRGLLTSNVVESGGFVDTTGGDRPDLQFHVLPVLVGDVEREPLPGHGLSINPCFLRPLSRGSVALRSADPAQPILFDAGALREQADVDTLVRGVKLARKILRAPALAAVIEQELLPGAATDLSDDHIEAHVRSHAKTVYHPAGTCRMGSDTGSVVDTELRVRGVPGLRVCDASVMPTLPSGNTNAPTIMIAERCADFVLRAR
ncbi:GMC family oxidoreductase [Ramlibacter sp. WS9]|uniref:GMC family oxidoreductase n=1 Tax=Ramlibacter sp. WS9 TaxID=1882741 RepID=UPI001142BEFB|nr:GMC family oxidoreductase N-terminal domain-containing protein [Ramlibacter sp. WS9]ROZ71294.1 GMC family oxidoreductase [Ramlibacter sp. WS9]